MSADHPYESQLVLSDLINRVLDKGVVLSGDLIISVADVDLVKLELTVLLHAIETGLRHPGRPRPPLFHADVPVLPPPGGR